ncbi:MAG TPA: hypothetical protein VHE35_16475 [Kofleriaceae bacterium]|nr:hypothetical protein [Kofleriaceae bacterium]
MRAAWPSSIVVAGVAIAGCGGGGAARGPRGWEQAPQPSPEEEIATTVLTELAGSAITGFQPIGVPVGRDLKEGEVMTYRVDWQPGRCYAAVAGGLGTIEELELWIVASGPSVWPGKIVATDEGHGNLAIAGERDHCFTPTYDLPHGGLVVKVAKGAGLAAVQLYAR